MCDCIAEVNRRLEEDGLPFQIDGAFEYEVHRNPSAVQIIGPRAQVAVYRKDPKSRKPLLPLLASYCPFCGTAIGQDRRLALRRKAGRRKQVARKPTHREVKCLGG